MEFPDDGAGAKRTGVDAIAKSTELFRVTREEIGTFPGNWEPLRGKSVKLYSVQPAQSLSQETLARDKRNFAKEIFLRAVQQQSTPEATIAGVVVIFDSADGGQASSTLASLKLWRDGKISESAFWDACSLDRTGTFSAAPKKP